jgi:AcrR family transcriptional regulator
MVLDISAVVPAGRSRPSRPRADAARNRERIVAAACEAIVELGPDVALDEVARRAGVGNATLYRHFSDRGDLLRHVTLSVVARTVKRAEDALAQEPDAFAALCRFVHEAVDERIGTLCSLLTDAIDRQDPEVINQIEQMERSVSAVLQRAQSSGQVRSDIAVGDVMVAVTQLARPLPGTCCASIDRFARRHMQLFLDGLRAPARSVLPGAAATLEDLQASKP